MEAETNANTSILAQKKNWVVRLHEWLPPLSGLFYLLFCLAIAAMGQRQFPNGGPGLNPALICFGIATVLLVLGFDWPFSPENKEAVFRPINKKLVLIQASLFIVAVAFAIFASCKWKISWQTRSYLVMVTPAAFLALGYKRFGTLDSWIVFAGTILMAAFGALASWAFFPLPNISMVYIFLGAFFVIYSLLWLNSKRAFQNLRPQDILGYLKLRWVPIALLVLSVIAYLICRRLYPQLPLKHFGVAIKFDPLIQTKATLNCFWLFCLGWVLILLLFVRYSLCPLPKVAVGVTVCEKGRKIWRVWTALGLVVLAYASAAYSAYLGWKFSIGPLFYVCAALGVFLWLAAVMLIPPNHTKKILWTGVLLALIYQLGAIALWGLKRGPNAGLLPFFMSWIPGLTSMIWLDRIRRPQPEERVSPPWARWEIVVFILILGVACFFRFWKLADVPYGIWFDEARESMDGWSPFEGKPYSPLSYYASPGTLSFNFYVLALWYKLFGYGLIQARSLVALTGVLTVLAIHLLGRMLLGRGPSLVAASFLACSGWHVNFTRFFMEPPLSVLFVVFTFYFLIRAIRSRRFTEFLLCGASVGFGIMTYAPTRLVPIMLLLLFIHQCLSRKGFLKNLWYAPLLIALGGQLASCPINVAAFTNYEVFSVRMKQTSVFKHEKTFEKGWSDICISAKKHILMFNHIGDGNGRHGLPLAPKLDPVTGACFALGLLACCFRWRYLTSSLFAVWLLMGLLAGILTLEWEAPQSCRTQLVIPACMLLAGVPFAILNAQLAKLFGRWKWIPFLAVAFPVMLWVNRWNYDYYFVRMMQKDPNVYQEFVGRDTTIARYLRDLKRNDYYFIHQQPEGDYPAIPFLLRQEHINGVIYRMPDFVPLRTETPKSIHYLLEPWRTPIPEALFKHYYPNGTFKEHKSPFNDTIFYTFITSATEAASIKGLTAQYVADASGAFGGKTWNRVERNNPLGPNDKADSPPKTGMEATWTGSIYVERTDVFRFSWSDGEPPQISLDGQPLAAESSTPPHSLCAGWHDIEARRALTGNEQGLMLLWGPPGGALNPVSLDCLCCKKTPGFGYYGTYYGDLNWNPPASFGMIQPTLSIRWHPEPISSKLHWAGKWSAYLRVDKPGKYGFIVLCNAYCRILIDGKQILEQPNKDHNPGKCVTTLEPGEHALDVYYREPGQYSELRVLWQPPLGNEEIIPFDRLRPKRD